MRFYPWRLDRGWWRPKVHHLSEILNFRVFEKWLQGWGRQIGAAGLMVCRRNATWSTEIKIKGTPSALSSINWTPSCRTHWLSRQGWSWRSPRYHVWQCTIRANSDGTIKSFLMWTCIDNSPAKYNHLLCAPLMHTMRASSIVMLAG